MNSSTHHPHQGYYLTHTMANELVGTTYGSYSSMPWPNQGPFSSNFMLGNGVEEKEGLAKQGGGDQQNKDDGGGEDEEELGVMKEMMFKMAAMQPVEIDPATIQKPRRRNVRISDDPQSVAARLRRERISQKIRILQRLVPGGTKMDTASMLDEAIRYVKFLKRQIHQLNSASS